MSLPATITLEGKVYNLRWVRTNPPDVYVEIDVDGACMPIIGTGASAEAAMKDLTYAYEDFQDFADS